LTSALKFLSPSSHGDQADHEVVAFCFAVTPELGETCQYKIVHLSSSFHTAPTLHLFLGVMHSLKEKCMNINIKNSFTHDPDK
jgi:hypothetical protein